MLTSKLPKFEKWCSDEEIGMLEEIINYMPFAKNITHNDLHPGNIMIQDGELMIIDMSYSTIGPAVCDMISIYRNMIAAPKTMPQAIEQAMGMPSDLIRKAGLSFFVKYKGFSEARYFRICRI